MKFLSDAVFAEIKTELAWLRGMVSTQAKEIVELKRDGFARPQPALIEQQKATPLDDRIMAAIRAMAPEGSRLESELVQYANAALLADAEIEDIADSIMAGSTIGDD